MLEEKLKLRKKEKVKRLITREINLLKRDNKKGKIPDIAFKQAKQNLFYIVERLIK